MEKIDTFVTASVHTKGDKRFIRVRFQVAGDQYLTAFNPKGVSTVQWVQRTSRTTGKVRTQSRWPVTVRFTRDGVVGSDVVKAELSPRDFTPQAIAAADAADLAALDAVQAPVQPAAAPAQPAQAPAAPAEEPLA